MQKKLRKQEKGEILLVRVKKKRKEGISHKKKGGGGKPGLVSSIRLGGDCRGGGQRTGFPPLSGQEHS